MINQILKQQLTDIIQYTNMKYYKYTTEEEVKTASFNIEDLNTTQPLNQRVTIYSYPWYTNGTDWVLEVNGLIPTGSVLNGVESITSEEALQQGYIQSDI